jgi:hypothetical protein
MNEYTKTVKELVQFGVNVQTITNNEITPLYFATANKCTEIVRELV